MEENTISCVVCNELFTPNTKHQKKCGNLCNVRTFQRRERIRALLMKLHTPAQLTALELFAEALTEEKHN